MSNNFKLLIFFSILIVIAGVTLILYGISSDSKNPEVTQPTKVGESTQSGNVESASGQTIKVIKVVDGDTIKIATGETVRLLGVDTPETVDPRRPVGCFGKEASNILKSLLEGQEVFLEKDISETDKYQRLLRFVYLPLDSGEKLFVNDYLIREGFGKVLTIPPDVKFSEQFLEAQQEARQEKRGLWGRC